MQHLGPNMYRWPAALSPQYISRRDRHVVRRNGKSLYCIAATLACTNIRCPLLYFRHVLLLHVAAHHVFFEEEDKSPLLPIVGILKKCKQARWKWTM